MSALSRRALIVGLGDHGQRYLQETAHYFKQHGAARDIGTLWLPPTQPDSASRSDAIVAETLPLTTNIDTLNTLYYQAETRAWCG